MQAGGHAEIVAAEYRWLPGAGRHPSGAAHPRR